MVTGEATGLGIGVGRPAGMGARGAPVGWGEGAGLAGGAGGGVGEPAANCSAVGKVSFMMAETYVPVAGAGEGAGVGCCATTLPTKVSRARSRHPPMDNTFTSPPLKPLPRPTAKFFRNHSGSGSGSGWLSSKATVSPVAGIPRTMVTAR